MSHSAIAELLNLTDTHYPVGRFFIPFMAMGGWLIGVAVCRATEISFQAVVVGLTIGAGTQVIAIAVRALLDIADTVQDRRRDDLLAQQKAAAAHPIG
jgi:hypothetical protein